MAVIYRQTRCEGVKVWKARQKLILRDFDFSQPPCQRETPPIYPSLPGKAARLAASLLSVINTPLFSEMSGRRKKGSESALKKIAELSDLPMGVAI